MENANQCKDSIKALLTKFRQHAGNFENPFSFMQKSDFRKYRNNYTTLLGELKCNQPTNLRTILMDSSSH